VSDARGDAERPSYEQLEALLGEQARLIEALQARIAEQDVVIEELERRVNRNSGNSSLPPSQDSPMTRRGAAAAREGEG
jgi:Family of unknown function (DUF6444)